MIELQNIPDQSFSETRMFSFSVGSVAVDSIAVRRMLNAKASLEHCSQLKGLSLCLIASRARCGNRALQPSKPDEGEQPRKLGCPRDEGALRSPLPNVQGLSPRVLGF